MALVKLEINGKRVIADNSRTILQVARDNGICDIPTLCHDEQLEPFASCFLCVVKVKGARTLVPACSTKVAAGMVVETDTPEVRRSRKAALELLLSNHYADCIGPCQLACPAGVDIQGYVALAALGKFTEAVGLIKERNPLPAICGRVCTRPCEVKGCRRNMLDEAVGIDYIKRYIADLDLGKAQPFRPQVAPPNGHRVAVVGAGPAGLSAAYYLAIRGYAVDIFEAMPEAGGMLRYGIPEYRLPKEVLDLEVAQILDLGVRLHTNQALGKDFTVKGLKESGYEAVFLGLGAWESQTMRVKDEDAAGVLSGIEFLKNFGLRRKIDIHGRVLVVGGGNTAIDCARTALRLGAREVRLLYRRTQNEMPANKVEIEEALHEGVQMDFLVAPTRVVKDGERVVGLECQRMELGEPDASGRRSPKPVRGSEFVIDCDFVIAAIGQSTRIGELTSGKVPGMLPFGETLNLTRWQTVQVDEATMETSVEGVFSGGDVVTGAATAIEAIAAGRKAAHAIDTYIRTGKAQPEPKEFVSRKDTFAKVTLADLRSQQPAPHRPMPLIPLEERVKGFGEVELGYALEDVRAETARCLECGCVALFECDLRRYASEYGVEVKQFLGEAKRHEVDRSHPLIELDQNKCILCGRCVRICSELVGVNAYGFVQRGFSTMVKPVLGGSLLDTDCVTCGLCVGTCPTGAIAARVPLAKPGPWATDSTVSTCHYCSVGCQLAYQAYGNSLIKVGRVEASANTLGAHCKKGAFGYDHVQAEDRLTRAWIRPGRELQETTLDDALSYTALRLKELARRFTPEEMAVFVSPRLTNEELYLAQKLARIGFGTHNVGSFTNLVNDEYLCPEIVSTATYLDLSDAQAVLVVNSNLDEEHFVADLMVKRAIRNGGRLVFIGPESNRTSAFAEVHLACKPGTQSWVVLGLVAELAARGKVDLEDWPELANSLKKLQPGEVEKVSGIRPAELAEAADVIAGAVTRVVVFNKDYRGKRIPGDDRLFAAAAKALMAPFLALWEKSNMQGLLDMGAHPRWFPGYQPLHGEAVDALEKEWCVVLQDLRNPNGDLGRALASRRIRVAVVLGEDPLGNEKLPASIRNGLLATDFLVVGDVVMTATAKAANVVLPLSAHAETSGTMTNAEHRLQAVRQAIPPRAGMETWQIISQLAARMGLRFKMKYSSPEEILAEIRRVVPLYRALVLNGQPHEAVWNEAALPLPGVGLPELREDSLAEPLSTLLFDHLEARFARRMETLFAEARAAKDS
ncbi:MAG TPA: FAD-dependent oxidoreductase [Thermoanaerobaculaceae bacterium]|nr:FAD-dependent oxidoreductase [Thermoanaerobaculaceae bacterium]HRS17094.1 FAD-dependent oxidoreductase [Thermoanaerobaculaceae bacterium]